MNGLGTQHLTALAGNPNCGKTTLFNEITGARQHVGNYPGITVEKKEGFCNLDGHQIRLVDLPGTYSLTAYSLEELVARDFLIYDRPAVVINIVDASNLERNLYLTIQLLELGIPLVLALNMIDAAAGRGVQIDSEELSRRLQVPVIPTVAKSGKGKEELLRVTLKHAEEQPLWSPLHISYGPDIDPVLDKMEAAITEASLLPELPARWTALKYLEADEQVMTKGREINPELSKNLEGLAEAVTDHLQKTLESYPEAIIADHRYGFIAGGLKETLSEKTQFADSTRLIDTLVTHKYLGFPLFFLFLWVMFEATFRLGGYPMAAIEWLVEQTGNLVRGSMAEGPLKDLIVDGIIGGVGGVIVFLPNIVILYLFIAFMEDSGYMSRAAFIMDKVMHRIGLHGKSFIPLIMGFGCNVPAIMATRTIESRSSRMITMFIVPFMSCSARLPVYILFVSAFFPSSGSLILLGLYAFGILIAALTARLFRDTLFREDETPFVMELPPYRMPTLKSVTTHMWDRSRQYLQKMGGPILIGSIIIWFLGYFPHNQEREAGFDVQIAQVEMQHAGNTTSDTDMEEAIAEIEHQRNREHQVNSYIGRIGHFMEPVMRPLGFDWKISVSLLSGMAAKEIVISTMGVLYTGDSDDQQSLKERLQSESYADGSPVFSPLVIAGFLLFVLIYFPCIATIIAIKEESHSWRWALFSVFYSTGLAWLVAFLVFQIGSLLM